ncbi:hypothetical protein PYCC9005_000748 [Savitreella phatthalungensis]
MDAIRASRHPVALVLHLGFKSASLLAYLLGLLFTTNFILVFVVVVLLLALDFWTVKNVSGRLLVRMRWYNATDPDGRLVWIFESAESLQSSTDSRIFWLTLYATPGLWLGLALVAVVKFELLWLTLVLAGCVLSGINAVAYAQCDRTARSPGISLLSRLAVWRLLF